MINFPENHCRKLRKIRQTYRCIGLNLFNLVRCSVDLSRKAIWYFALNLFWLLSQFYYIFSMHFMKFNSAHKFILTTSITSYIYKLEIVGPSVPWFLVGGPSLSLIMLHRPCWRWLCCCQPSAAGHLWALFSWRLNQPTSGLKQF